MKIKHFFDPATSTFTYVVIDEKSNECAIIDSVLDYDQYSAKVKTESADKVIKYIKDNNLKNKWILETHIHADHITAAFYLKQHVGGKTGIGKHITKVLDIWVKLFETQGDTPLSGKQFDELFDDNHEFKIGNINVKVIHTSGHTPACASYILTDDKDSTAKVFVGDTIFAPNIGTARCDFPGGSIKEMYESVQKFYALPDDTILYLCHDYPKAGEEPTISNTVGEHKRLNAMIKANTTFEEYFEKRSKRDKALSVPKLLLPSIQTNLRLGDFGVESQNGLQFIRIPVNALEHI